MKKEKSGLLIIILIIAAAFLITQYNDYSGRLVRTWREPPSSQPLTPLSPIPSPYPFEPTEPPLQNCEFADPNGPGSCGLGNCPEDYKCESWTPQGASTPVNCKCKKKCGISGQGYGMCGSWGCQEGQYCDTGECKCKNCPQPDNNMNVVNVQGSGNNPTQALVNGATAAESALRAECNQHCLRCKGSITPSGPAGCSQPTQSSSGTWTAICHMSGACKCA